MRNQQTLQTKASSLDKYQQQYIEFIEMASHDLKSPLRKLEVFTEKLVQSCEQADNENRRTYLERVNSALAQMKS